MTYEEAKHFIESESNSGCKLISKTYINNREKIEVKCKCGNTFDVAFTKFKSSNKRQCNDCSRKNRLLYSIDDVKEYIKARSDCELLSGEYVNVTENLLLLCKCGNTFEKSMETIRRTNKIQCRACSYKDVADKRGYSYEYIKNFIEVESDSGCKLLSKEYKDTESRLLIQCKCNNVFSTTFTTFRRDNKRQCDDCVGILWKHNRIKNYIENKSVSGCKLLSKNCKGVNNKIKIRCPCGNTFKTTLNNFKRQNKRKCDDCNSNLLDYGDVKQYIESNSNCKLLSTEYKGIDKRMKFLCECGEVFETSLNSFKHANKRQCYICGNATSSRERETLKYLKDKRINFLSEYSFSDCRNIHPLPFDFAIFNDDKEILFLIEIDGEQHYYPVNFGGCSDQIATKQHLKAKRNDRIKSRYCKSHNIPLLRIPYWEFKNIEKILEEWLCKFNLVIKPRSDVISQVNTTILKN